MSLETLPPEITLHILSYLPIFSFLQLRLLSRTWNSFVERNEDIIYQQAAVFHGIIDSGSTTFDTIKWREKFSERVLAGVNNWKQLCQRRLQLQRSWNGASASAIRPKPLRRRRDPEDDFFEMRERVHRIKVDEKRRLILTTTGLSRPQVAARDMDTGNALWLLWPSFGRSFSHLEYSEGFFTIDRGTGQREVWRLIETQSGGTGNEGQILQAEQPEDFDPNSSPDATMLEDSNTALSLASSLQSDMLGIPCSPLRGCFEPYALLQDKEVTRASRLCYPTLLTSGKDNVYLWDIPTARVVEVIHGIQNAKLTEVRRAEASESPGAQKAQHDEGPAPSMRDGSSQSSVTPSVALQEDYAGSDSEWDDIDDGQQPHEPQDGSDLLDDDDDDDVPPNTVPNDLSRLRGIRYVDHSPSHVFLAGQYTLKIFAKSSALGVEDSHYTSSKLVFTLSSSRFRYGRWHYVLNPDSRNDELSKGAHSSLSRYTFDVSEEKRDPNPTSRLFDEFKAVHVSPCGSHFAALLSGGRLLIVSHFRRLIGKPEDEIYDSILDVQLSSPSDSTSVYLAYEEGDGGEGKIGVVTTRGIFVLTFPPFTTSHQLSNAHPLRVCRLKEYMDPLWLHNISCLMISDTYLFVTYCQHPRSLEESKWVRDFEEGLRHFKTKGVRSYVLKNGAHFVTCRLGSGSFINNVDHSVHALDLFST